MIIVIIRTLIVFFSLMIIMRILGKRQLAEMELSEFVVASLAADLAAHPLQDIGIPMINGLVPIIILFCCEILLIWISGKSIHASKLFFGKPSLLIDHGKINVKEMENNRFSNEELMQELRNKSCLDIDEVQYAVLETNGHVNVILMPQHSPVTAEQMGTETVDDGYPHIVVSKGKVSDENMKLLGLDRQWLDRQLKQNGKTDVSEVYLMTVTDKKKIKIYKEDDQIEKK